MGDGNNDNKCQCQCQQGRNQEVDKNSGEVAHVWRDFLHETSFHGCRNIEDRRRSIIYRVLWTMMVLGMLSGLLHTLFQSYVGYREYRVDSKSRIEVHREMPFPAVTVCSAASINIARKNMSQMLKDYIARGTILGFLVPELNLSDPASRELERMTIKELSDEFTISELREFITYDEWHGVGNIAFKQAKSIVASCFLANGIDNIAQKAMATAEGRTGGLEMIMNIRRDGVIMQEDMTYGAMVFVHDPKEKARTLESGVMVAPGYSSYINLKATKYKFLPEPYKSYGQSYCVETDDRYSHEACVSDWSFTRVATFCNCTTGGEPNAITEKFPSCSLKQYSDCYRAKHAYFLKQTLKADFTECPKPCAFTRYETSMSFSKFPSDEAAEKMVLLSHMYGSQYVDLDYIRKNVLKVTIYFDRFFLEHIEYEPEVTINSILSSLGGQMGFFLGASLVTVAELGEALLRSFWTLGKKLKVTGTGSKTKVTSLQKS